jgi:hypothetical protein
MRYELADYEWAAIKPMLPNKPRGVPRVNDRRVLNGIFWILRSGAPWHDLPDAFGLMSAGPSHLVQILLPKETGKRQPIGKDWFDSFLKELTDKFGGATSFLRAPGQGLWQSGGGKEKDSIAVVEVMAKRLDPS